MTRVGQKKVVVPIIVKVHSDDSVTSSFILVSVIGLTILLLIVPSAWADPWGNVALGDYPPGEKGAPNQLIYDPLLFLSEDMNIGDPQCIYIFL